MKINVYDWSSRSQQNSSKSIALHPRLTRRAAWLDRDGLLPIIEGTVIRPEV
ncbi:hypothetical protein [Streptomyces lutosisoli]|uniref:Uncharacterized protein n=1 Tax=Streptomyces lutosisoli TaxID=2665721 RepID=A0ABW2VWR3_9ACTN